MREECHEQDHRCRGWRRLSWVPGLFILLVLIAVVTRFREEERLLLLVRRSQPGWLDSYGRPDPASRLQLRLPGGRPEGWPPLPPGVMSEKNVPMKAENRSALRPSALFDELVDQLWSRPWMTAASPWMARRFEKEDLGFMPPIDVFRKDGVLVVKADLPGMKREDVHVALEEGDLVLKGERKEETKVEKEDYYKAECVLGSFYRRLPLTFEVKPEDVAAKFADGVLEVTVPVPSTVKPKATEIAIS